MTNKKWLLILKNLYCRFQDDEIPALGAQLTYYLLLAFFPFLIFVLTLLSYTHLASEEALVDLSRFLPANAYEVVHRIVEETVTPNRGTLLSFGMVAAFWLASNGVGALIRGINKAYDQEEKRPFWKVRGISLLFTLGMAVIIILSFGMLVFGELLGAYMFDILGVPHLFKAAWNIIRYLIPLAAMMLVFILLYHYTPNHRMRLKEVVPGSIFSTFGWVITSLVFSFYVNNFVNFSITYGSIGGIIVLLMWLYWSSIIVLIGGELNATLAFIRQGRLKPKIKHY